MIQPRKLNTAFDIARDGAAKVTTIAQPVPGQVRQTKPSHDFLHGAPISDEPNTPLAPKSYEKSIPIHGGMTKQQVEKFTSTGANDPNLILRDAANLGRARIKRDE